MKYFFALTLMVAPAMFAQDFGLTTTVAGPQAKVRAEANAALEAGDYAKAAKVLAPLAEASPKDARLLYDLGSAQDHLDQANAAEVSYRAAIANDDKMLEPRVALGLLLARNGKMDDARAQLGEAAAMPGDAALRGRAYRAMARIDQKSRPGDARDELLAALQLTPETSEDTLMAAELAASASNGTGAAEAAYRRVLLAKPDDAEATAGLAHLLVQQKHVAEAEAILNEALKAHPDDPGLSVQLASTYASEGKSAQALPLIEALKLARPEDTAVDRLLAGLYVDAGEWAKAEPLLAAITRENPNDTRSVDDLGRALVHLRRYAEAQAILTRIVLQPKLFPTPADLGEAAGHLAFAASENNDPAGALQAIAVRATVLPNSAPILFVAAISYDKLHQKKAAVEAYNAFLAASNGQNPDQEFQAHGRLVALDHMK